MMRNCGTSGARFKMTSFIQIPDIQIFTLTEAARYLKLTEAEVDKISKKLKVKVIGGKKFFLQTELDNFRKKELGV